MAKKKSKKVETEEDILENLSQEINGEYGENTLRFGPQAIVKVDSYPTGVSSIDSASGIGGFPKGRIVEIFGPESSGKTTLCLQAAAAVQNSIVKGRPGRVAFIDAEYAVDPEWANAMGCDFDKFIFSQPEYGEQGYEIAYRIAKSKLVDLIVVDSVAALTPKKQIEAGLDKSTIGLHAQMNSKAMTKIKGVMSDNDCTILLVNQIREKVGVTFGSSEQTSGGRAIRFYASQRVDVRRIGSIKEGDKIIGNHVRAKFIKNKCAPPFRQAEFFITWGDSGTTYGINKEMTLVNDAKNLGIIKTSGSWYRFKGENIGNGLTASTVALRNDKNLYNEIYEAVLNGGISEDKKSSDEEESAESTESTESTESAESTESTESTESSEVNQEAENALNSPAD